MDQKDIPMNNLPTQEMQDKQPNPSMMPDRQKYMQIGVFLVVVMTIATIAFLLGRKSAQTNLMPKQNNSAAISPTEKPSPTSSASMTPGVYESKLFTNTWEGWIWKPFVLHYPASWSLIEEPTDQSVGPTLSLKVSKDDGSYFTIVQGFGEGGRCLYPEESDYATFQGMGSQYSSYDSLVVGSRFWRLSESKFPNDLQTHTICTSSSEKGTFQSGSDVVGFNTIKLVSNKAKQEFIEMLKSLEIK